MRRSLSRTCRSDKIGRGWSWQAVVALSLVVSCLGHDLRHCGVVVVVCCGAAYYTAVTPAQPP
eukprot:8079432-Heterocapsa_arctica.AAC.1